MKKVLLCGSALLLSLCFAKAQGWELNGARDDFGPSTFYKNGANLEGVVWWADNVFVLNRAGDGKMVVTATNAGGAGNYPLIGMNFNDSNDNGTGTSFTCDLSGGANITVDIENKATQLLFMDIKIEDINGTQSDIEPDVADVVGKTWADPNRKALNGFTLAAGERKTITINVSSVAGKVGGLTIGTYSCSGPDDCPTTSYSIDITKIKGVLFRTNFGSNNIDLSEGDGDPLTETFISGASIVPFTGDIWFHDFKIGTTTLTSTSDASVDQSLKVYPNPAKEQLNVSFDASGDADVTLTNIVGTKVFSATKSAGENNFSLNTSELTSGIYILNVATENGTVARKVSIK